ncbi:Sulphatase-modifying factor protein [Spongiactinospora gelatinilytica]|uniref:Sulphatase-modifying factor protein n=1 Tax=Spongiactinospora gelatinilytica TaxID=2666298 RepID=A0A2W2HBB9_9ACTN|nr:SUMF1/EgtB/PvdO family nonheme iron enzyme [Spongiactinospora gelatinilytica]PZG47480.1 Sulphatase-modifying factor protein [Spongiactinospora gelatinilytica]
MVLVGGGTALIGAPLGHLDAVAATQPYERSWFADEAPQHTVTVATFWLDRHPVTNAAFAAFTDATGYRTVAERRGYGLTYTTYWQQTPGACWRHPGGPGTGIADRPDHPVVHIALADARAYAAWAGMRLPTEAEWEKAAHGDAWSPWPWGHRWEPERACTADEWAGCLIDSPDRWRTWWQDHRSRHTGPIRPATVPAGTYSPRGDSPAGAADMAGNVMEWTSDAYRLYPGATGYDPLYDHLEGRYSVGRGGCWMMWAIQARTTERIAFASGYSNWATGFRCAADTVEPPEPGNMGAGRAAIPPRRAA